MPTTPELNEENNLKNCSVPKENQGNTNCYFKNYLSYIILRSLCCQSNRKNSTSQREYFYRRNPIYDQNSRNAVRSPHVLFTHSTLHAFKNVEWYDHTLQPDSKIRYEERDKFEYLLSTYETNYSGIESSSFAAKFHVKYMETSNANLNIRSLRRSSKSMAEWNRKIKKRWNLYDYPFIYYEKILNSLNEEANARIIL